MRVATCSVSMEGYGSSSGNPTRMKLMEETLKGAKGLSCDIVCFPGGYFSVQSDSKRDELAAQAVDLAKSMEIGLAVGIDCKPKDMSIDKSRNIRQATLPWYAVCWSPYEDTLHCWGQRSITSRDQWLAPETRCRDRQTLPFGNKGVEILMCGEIYNERIRDSIVRRRYDLFVVADLAHAACGFRVFQPMEILARQGVGSVCSCHAERFDAMKQRYWAGGSKQSVRRSDLRTGYFPTLGLKVWEF